MEITIEQLEKVQAELRGFVHYHVLKASGYIKDLEHLEDNIAKMKEEKNASS